MTLGRGVAVRTDALGVLMERDDPEQAAALLGGRLGERLGQFKSKGAWPSALHVLKPDAAGDPDGASLEATLEAEVPPQAPSIADLVNVLGGPRRGGGTTLWGAEILMHHAATCSYSWMRPPSTSRRLTCRGLAWGEPRPRASGTANARLRCGRCWL